MNPEKQYFRADTQIRYEASEKQAAGKMRFKAQEVCWFLHFSRIAKGFMRRVDIRHLTNIRFCVIFQAGYVGLP